MASGMVSRWPVVVEATIEPGDRDAAGAVTPGGLVRLFGLAWSAYLVDGPVLAGTAGETELLAEQQHGVATAGDTVDVALGVTELFAARVHVGVRVRSGTSDLSVEARWAVAVGEVTPALRDELIGRAHTAAYVL
jgi:hypothetical protein